MSDVLKVGDILEFDGHIYDKGKDGRIKVTSPGLMINDDYYQCFGSGSFWIRFILVSRIRFNETDPDPGRKILTKICKNH